METRNEAAATIVTLSGNLEGRRSAQFNDYFDQVFEQAPARVVVDLSQVEFMASTGLALLVSAYTRATNRTIAMVFACPPDSVVETLSITKLDTFLPLFRTVEEAIGQPIPAD